MKDQNVRQSFGASPAAVGEARLFLQSEIAGRVDPAVLGDLSLALSELASNAVQHAGTPFEVVIHTDGQVRIEVEDSSTGAPVPTDPTDSGGRGLAIVDQLCDRWGVHIVRDKKCVWCERDLPG